MLQQRSAVGAFAAPEPLPVLVAAGSIAQSSSSHMATTCSMASCGSRVTAFKGAQVVRAQRSAVVCRGATGAVMVKKGIHPEWHGEAKVICNGVEVMTVGGTKPVYNVDIYSGNHPFYQGNAKTSMVIDEGQVCGGRGHAQLLAVS